MNRLERALRLAARTLEDAGVRYALVGGLAVSVRTEPRFTRDADFAVAVATDEEAESVTHRFAEAGFAIQSVVEQTAAGRLATARLAPAGTGGAPVVDLLFASSGVESEIARSAERLRVLASWSGPVARVGHLIAMKLLSRDDLRRPQDLADLRALLAVATDDELELARAAVALITERGFDRGKALGAELDRLIETRV